MISAIVISVLAGLAVGAFGGYRFGAKATAAVKAELSTIATDVATGAAGAGVNLAARIKASAQKL